jgi:hypothetical protein
MNRVIHRLEFFSFFQEKTWLKVKRAENISLNLISNDEVITHHHDTTAVRTAEG